MHRSALGWLVGTTAFALPAAASAANVALEAPVGATVRNPGEAFEAIQALLEERGHVVTVVAGDEIDTLDEIQQFDTVVLSSSGIGEFDVTVYDGVIVDYVSQGGGLVISGWVYYFNDALTAPGLNTVAPFIAASDFIFGGTINLLPPHEIVDGLADWDNPSNDAITGGMKVGATAITMSSGIIDGAVWDYEGGRVASIGQLFTAEYAFYATQSLHDGSNPDATEMFLRAIEWTAAQAAPVGCHDGDIDPGEVCDDGNFSNTDDCVNPCVPASCGDHYVHAGFEPCDDGDLDNTDGCLVGCILPTCGDGFVHAGVETCDDFENGDNTDDCITGCQVATCGDGFLHAGIETCDDGDVDNSDDCPLSCQPAVCGDGFVLAGVEPCDDGNAENNDDCLVGCIAPSCGDGYLQNGTEACDDANNDDTDACVGAVCQLASCGDGFVFAGFEECDDGNQVAGDGCSACQQDSAESSSDGGAESSSDGGGTSTGTAEGTSSDGGVVDSSEGGTSTDPTEGGGTTGVDPTAASAGDTTGGGSETTTDAAIDDTASGCSCRSTPAPRAATWWLVGLGLLRRRRRRA